MIIYQWRCWGIKNLVHSVTMGYWRKLLFRKGLEIIYSLCFLRQLNKALYESCFLHKGHVSTELGTQFQSLARTFDNLIPFSPNSWHCACGWALSWQLLKPDLSFDCQMVRHDRQCTNCISRFFSPIEVSFTPLQLMLSLMRGDFKFACSCTAMKTLFPSGKVEFVQELGKATNKANPLQMSLDWVTYWRLRSFPLK